MGPSEQVLLHYSDAIRSSKSSRQVLEIESSWELRFRREEFQAYERIYAGHVETKTDGVAMSTKMR